MKHHGHAAHFGIAVLATFAALVVALPGRAAESPDASPWSEDLHAAIRLIAGTPAADRPRAGVEIRLAPGWHTYWRYPGDAGVPPQFDFAGSQNVARIEVRYPAPHRLEAGGATSIGYEGDVVLPLHVVARDPSKPVRLKLKIDYAICEKLCVPAEGSAELTLAGGKSARDAALTAAEGLVPQPVKLGETPENGPSLAIRKVWREPGKERPRVLVDVAAPAGATVDLFAEGPTAAWALPLPAPIAGGAPGVQRFAFDLDGLPPGETLPAVVRLRLTAVSPTAAIEVTTDLD